MSFECVQAFPMAPKSSGDVLPDFPVPAPKPISISSTALLGGSKLPQFPASSSAISAMTSATSPPCSSHLPVALTAASVALNGQPLYFVLEYAFFI